MFNSLDLPGLQLPSRCGSKRWLEVGNFCNIQNCYWTRFFLIQKNFFFPTDIEKRHLLTYPLALSLLLIWWFREWEWGWGGMLDIFFFLIHLGKERKWDFFSSSTDEEVFYLLFYLYCFLSVQSKWLNKIWHKSLWLSHRVFQTELSDC